MSVSAFSRGVILAVLLAGGFCCPQVFGQTQPSTQAATQPVPRHFPSRQEREQAVMNRTWQETAADYKLPRSQIEQLQRDKLVIGSRRFKQIFDPYLGSHVPHFITSDSLLNGFHVLFEESIRRLELVQCTRLPGLLHTLWDGLEHFDPAKADKPQLLREAKLRGQVIVGTALRLLGDETIKPDPATTELIAEQVKLITQASATTKPAWLGPPDAWFLAIDYSRFKPRGFYVQSERLQRYFRAVAWLQSIPFRIDRDEELRTIMLLANVHGSIRYDSETDKFFTAFHTLLGNGDDADVAFAIENVYHNDPLQSDSLQETRQWLKDHYTDKGQINDQVRFIPDDPHQAAEYSLRILPSFRTPDAVLFCRTTDPRQFEDRAYPSGLDVAAALGSPCARAGLTGPQRDKLLGTIDAAKPLFADKKTIYGQYLDCLQALLIPPEKDVPALFSSPPWQAKSCQTILGGWAQMRHTFALQSKENVLYMGMCANLPGFVEPVPEFYGRMAALCRRSRNVLELAGAFGSNLSDAAGLLRQLADLADKTDAIHKGSDSMWKLPDSEIGPVLQGGLQFQGGVFDEALPKQRQWADELDHGRVPDEELVHRTLSYASQPDLRKLWLELGELSQSLESLAHKQLRGVPFNDRDNAFVLGYGARLAGIMLYGGNSYVVPRDDAPRIVDVCSNPIAQKVLEVGIGRPQVLYVLYPWQGREILCRGAIMPYYEFPSEKRLTDEEFKGLLDSPAAPALPAWVQPIYGGK